MRMINSLMMGAAVMAISVTASASGLDGPLTDQQGLAREQARQQAAQLNAASEQASTSTSAQSMPQPVNTQFSAKVGGAPVGTAEGESVSQALPPVVDLTHSTRGTVGVEPSQQASLSQSISAPLAASATLAAPAQSTLPTVQGSPSARLARVERQLANLTRMNMPQQLSDMQLELQQLSGQLQVQEHDIKLLNKQQRTFYQDLDQRLKKFASAGGANTPAPTPSKNVTTSNIQLQDSNTYKAAFDLLLKRRYSDAETGLKKYLSDYPNGEFIYNAHYWLGELYLMKKDYKQSQNEFALVIANAPKSPRIPDAKFKLGLIQLYQGERLGAKRAFLAVKKAYPDSTAAQLASIQLKQLGS